MSTRPRVAIIGSGNIGTDLLVKSLRSQLIEPVAMVGIDPLSDGLRRAGELGVQALHGGIDDLLAQSWARELAVVFDATSAKAHEHHAALLAREGIRAVDLTPAAVGPGVVPVANLTGHLNAPNVNMVTCGGQATIPVIWAISEHTRVMYAEIVASIASRSAGPGTRANIDEFTVTTARAIETIGRAERGKAIIILNPADPPLIMRDTVHVFCETADPHILTQAVEKVVARVARYVPGYRLVQKPVFEAWSAEPLRMPGYPAQNGWKVSVFLEVRGNGDYLPPYAGNLDIMTAAALRTGEVLACGPGAHDV